jgi:hypothetical protein
MQILLTSALVVGEWLASCPCRFIPGERASDANWIGVWVDPRGDLEDLEKKKILILPGVIKNIVLLLFSNEPENKMGQHIVL